MKRFFYGTKRDGSRTTIHATEKLDVEVDADGRVVSVWFRCMLLPFKQIDVDDRRAADMRGAYEGGGIPRLLGLELEEAE